MVGGQGDVGGSVFCDARRIVSAELFSGEGACAFPRARMNGGSPVGRESDARLTGASESFVPPIAACGVI